MTSGSTITSSSASSNNGGNNNANNNNNNNKSSSSPIKNLTKKASQLIKSTTSPSESTNEEPLTEGEEAKMVAEIAQLNSMVNRYDKFRKLIDEPNVDLARLRKLAWQGVPEQLRSVVWQLLMGYLPTNSDRRDQVLARKRKEYEEYVAQSFGKGQASLDQQLYHQIHIDVLRTQPGCPLFQKQRIRECLERVLYCWAIRHPASGYVQGINDLVTPFFAIFLSKFVEGDVENADISNVTDETFLAVEADSFWCLTKLLDGIQDNYTFAQPGIQRQIVKLKELINRIDAPLYNHLQSQGIEFIQFAFRWMNCLLMREISLKNTVRMWDTYQAEGNDGFSEFHLYVCAAFLVKWSDRLKKMEFQELMIFLQSLPTQTWGDKDVELLLSEAYMWKSLFHYSPSHLAVGAGNGGGVNGSG